MDKREVRKEYKSKKTPKGVFAIRCATTADVWVRASNHLDSQQNSLWFQLRAGSHMNKRLQELWNAHGEAAFSYEILETFDDDAEPLALPDLSAERQKHWRETLNAQAV